MDLVSTAVGYAGTAFQLLLLVLLLVRGPFVRYLPLFIFTASAFLGSIVEGYMASLYVGKGLRTGNYFKYYWTCELLTYLALLFLSFVLTRRILESHALRTTMMRFLTGILLAVLLLPFILFSGSPFTTQGWNVSTSQMLTFGAALMCMGFWMVLITEKRRDRQLMTVALGLGILVSGTAFTMGIYKFTKGGSELRNYADYALRFTQIASNLIWCWAFWPETKIAKVDGATATQSLPRQ